MHFLEIFGQKKCLFGSKTVFLGQEVHYYMVYIAYFTELILQICDYAQKGRIWRDYSYCIRYSVIKDTLSLYCTKYKLCSAQCTVHNVHWRGLSQRWLLKIYDRLISWGFCSANYRGRTEDITFQKTFMYWHQTLFVEMRYDFTYFFLKCFDVDREKRNIL